MENMEKRTTTVNRRELNRSEFQRQIQYIVQDNPDQILRGTTIDISDSGVGLYVFNPLYEGQRIIVKSETGDLNNIGIVRWCKEQEDNMYRAGLLFF